MIHGIDSLNGGYSMRITQDFLNHLAPIELSFIQASITKLCRNRIADDTTIMIMCAIRSKIVLIVVHIIM